MAFSKTEWWGVAIIVGFSAFNMTLLWYLHALQWWHFITVPISSVLGWLVGRWMAENGI